MRAIKLPLLALTTVAFAAPAMAQDAAAPAAPQGAAPATGAADSGPVSDAEITQFATAVMEVEKINKDTAVPAAEKQPKMASAVTSSGLTPERFNSIATAMNTDSALQAKVGAAIQAKAPAAGGMAPAPGAAPAPGTAPAPGMGTQPPATPGTPQGM